jgi:4-oxalocrotonate tautomerase family enzyme
VKIDTFFAELKRRNVYKVAVAYIVAGWALSQGIAQVFPLFDVPNSAIRAIVLLIILGLPVALVLAWMFELTSQGIKRTETADAMPAAAKPQKYTWIYVVVIGGAISVGLFSLGRYTASNNASASRTETAAVPGKSIAVLPFENLSDDKNTAYFSDGITEEILNALAQIPNLKVAARRSAFQFKGTDLDLRKIGQVLGVAHILEGSLQKAGDQVRINVQLIENVFTPEQKKEMIEKVSEAMISIEGEALRPYTLVKIDEVKDGNWSVGGKIINTSDVHRLQHTKVKAA